MARHFIISAALVAMLGPAAAMAQDDPTDLVAIAIRDHGQPCTNPTDAERDEMASSPDEQAWTVSCDEGRYRVKFMGDTGAEVTSIGG
jgi:hypothetical protein